MRGLFLYAIAGSFCAGVALELLFSLGMSAICVFLVLAVSLLLLVGKHRNFLVMSVILASLSLGIVRADVFLFFESGETLSDFVGESAQVKGVVSSDPDRRESSLRVSLAVESVNDTPAKGELIAVVPRETDVSAGDTLVVKGKLSAPAVFETTNGHAFDYPSYLRARGVSALVERATVVSKTSGPWSLEKILFSVKHAFESALERVLPEPEVSLLEGILLGERGGFPPALTNAFVIVGLIHIVVLSGSNISVVSEGIFRALSFLPRNVSLAVGAAAIILFAVMTGGGAATVRAVVMGLIAILARYYHRTSSALAALCVAAVVMVAWNPLIILYDSGFILSILATFGLITLSPTVERYVPQIFWSSVRSIVATTLAVEIFILPALLYFSGVFSFFSLPANILVLPFVPAVMFFGFVTGLLSLAHPILAFVPALVTDVLLRWILFVTTTIATLPGAYTTIAAFPGWVAALAYIPLVFVATYCFRRNVFQQHSS